MSYWKNSIKRDNPRNPVRKPNHTCRGLWKSSLSLDDNTNPTAKTAETRYQTRGVYILNESSNTKANNDPAATECREIFHRRLIIVTIKETNVTAKINDFRKTGIGNLKIMKEVVE
jgi:hypothetical protein